MMAKKDRKDQNMETTHKKGSGKLILATTFLSGITGALIAYMTPKTGEIVREKILSYFDSFKESDSTSDFKQGVMERSNDAFRTLNQGVTKFLEHGFSLVEDSKELFTAAYLAGKEAYDKGEEATLLEGKKEDSSHHEQEDIVEQSAPVTHEEEKEADQELATRAQEEDKDIPPEKDKTGS